MEENKTNKFKEEAIAIAKTRKAESRRLAYGIVTFFAILNGVAITLQYTNNPIHVGIVVSCELIILLVIIRLIERHLDKVQSKNESLENNWYADYWRNGRRT